MSGPVLCVVGARPNYMKAAPVMAALARRAPQLEAKLVHTGQHYDHELNERFFEDLGLAPPAFNLGVGSGSHARQTADVMTRFEPLLEREGARAVLVVGDVNSTLACALVAAKLGVPVAHVEAGLRSFDRAMPEEINRVLTDQVSDLLFTTERTARDNLLREGIAEERIRFVGNAMIDTLRQQLPLATPPAQTLAHHLGASAPELAGGFALATLHRPSNVDDPVVLAGILDAFGRLGIRMALVVPLHPRTRERAEAFGLGARLCAPGVHALPPVGYLEMLGLMGAAKLVLTDSGGIQEETTALGVPCLTLRENTERPITVEQGTNTVVGVHSEAISRAADEILATGGKRGRLPELWDGRAAERIADALAERYGGLVRKPG